MPALSTAVKWCNQSFSGIPALSAAAGALVAILDAVLVNGYNVSSVSQIVVTSGVARATLTSGGAFARKAVALIAGCATTELNGEKRITSIGTGYIEYDATGVADGTYNTGTITAKYAPMGWEILFTDTNKRIYRSTNVADREDVYLHIDDTNPTGYASAAGVAGTYRSMAKVQLVISPTDINTFTSLGSAWWIKSNTSTGSSARNFMICGDDLGFFYSASAANSNYSSFSEYFGKLNNLFKPGDVFSTLMTGWDGYGGWNSGASANSAPGDISNSSAIYNVSHSFGNLSGGMAGTTRYIARSHSQIGNAASFYLCGNGLSGYTGQGPIAYPSPIDNGLHFASDVLCYETGQGPRGTVPGYCQILHTRPFGQGYMLENVASDPDKTFITWNGYSTAAGGTPTSVYIGEWMFDIIGPWR